ncbi:MAG: NAD-dependent protein deacetylase [Candidatus Baldrarchaeia archaeon]
MEVIKEAADLIGSSNFVVALTGAGISAESGIPTFRGKNGLWRKYRAEDLATPEAFARNPRLVWEWYVWRMKIIGSAEPNPGHIALAKMEEMGILKALITQNVDGLHRRAGSRNVLELHGNIWRVRCVDCGFSKMISKPPEQIPPKCEECGGLLRPDVVWFGEPLPKDVLNRAIYYASRADLMLVIGTSAVVQPAASLPLLTKRNGGILIEINISDTPLTPICDLTIREKAGVILPKILEEIG